MKLNFWYTMLIIVEILLAVSVTIFALCYGAQANTQVSGQEYTDYPKSWQEQINPSVLEQWEQIVEKEQVQDAISINETCDCDTSKEANKNRTMGMIFIGIKWQNVNNQMGIEQNDDIEWTDPIGEESISLGDSDGWVMFTQENIDRMVWYLKLMKDRKQYILQIGEDVDLQTEMEKQFWHDVNVKLMERAK